MRIILYVKGCNARTHVRYHSPLCKRNTIRSLSESEHVSVDDLREELTQLLATEDEAYMTYLEPFSARNAELLEQLSVPFGIIYWEDNIWSRLGAVCHDNWTSGESLNASSETIGTLAAEQGLIKSMLGLATASSRVSSPNITDAMQFLDTVASLVVRSHHEFTG